MRRLAGPLLASALALSSCAEKVAEPPPEDAGADVAAEASAPVLDPEAELSDAGAPDAPPPKPHCPHDMVLVRDRVCVDRYETSLVDADTSMPLSPYYPPLKSFDQYLKSRHNESARLLADVESGGEAAAMPFPVLPDWQRSGRYRPKAISRRGATPSAYMMMSWARDACVNAGKRLCSLDEWQTACRGEQGRKFPYGDEYKPGVCNVFRESHPGQILFRKMSVGMLDPRMNKVTVKGKPLLRLTGATPECKSVWGDDAIYDMVGNLDEWVDDPEGTFAGGFYSRTSKVGCERVVASHTASYFDYSTGGRCCADPGEGRAPHPAQDGGTPAAQDSAADAGDDAATP